MQNPHERFRERSSPSGARIGRDERAEAKEHLRFDDWRGTGIYVGTSNLGSVIADSNSKLSHSRSSPKKQLSGRLHRCVTRLCKPYLKGHGRDGDLACAKPALVRHLDELILTVSVLEQYVPEGPFCDPRIDAASPALPHIGIDLIE